MASVGSISSQADEGLEKEILMLFCVLRLGRYVGMPDEVDNGVTFEEKMGAALTAELAVQMKEAEELDREMKAQFAKVGFEL